MRGKIEIVAHSEGVACAVELTDVGFLDRVQILDAVIRGLEMSLEEVYDAINILYTKSSPFKMEDLGSRKEFEKKCL